jgi:prepilin-type N-terminal cleavage/methylation domain-containing protein
VRRYSRSKGFSLIEVLVTLIIFSVSILAFAGLASVTTRNNSTGGHVTEAATFAQDKLEELRGVHWNNIPVGDHTDQIQSTRITYTRNWTVVANGRMKTVTIAVRWNDRGDHSIRIVSVISH